MDDSARGQSVEREALEKVLGSGVFRGVERSSRVLRYLVETSLAGQGERIKEYSIGVEALGRGEGFDPRIDSIARVEVSRLRARLEQYYLSEGRLDKLQIKLPKGGYIPVFERAQREEKVDGRTGTNWIWFFAGAALSGIAAFGLFLWTGRPRAQPEAASMRFEVDLGADKTFANVVGNQFALSPDGTNLVFSAAADGGAQLMLRKMGSGETLPLPGSEGARSAFFSPDGTWVAYWANGKLKKSPISGGAPTVLCDATDLLGGSWGEDGQIVATLAGEAKLWSVSETGGEPKALWQDTAPGTRLVWPQHLPAGKGVLFTRASTIPDAGSIEILRDGKTKTLVRNATYGRYASSGHLLYVNQGTVYAQDFDWERLEARGAAFPFIKNVDYSSTFGFAQFALSNNGLFVFRELRSQAKLRLAWLSRGGGSTPFLKETGPFLWPRVSPDGKYVALTRVNAGESEIVIYDRTGKPVANQLPAANYRVTPLWIGSSEFLIFQGRATLEAAAMPALASTQELLRGGVHVPWSTDREGKRLALYRLDPKTHFDLWTAQISTEGGKIRLGKLEPFLQSSAVETYPAFSPDGKWIAFASLKSGNYEVYVRSYPDNGTEVQISRGGGRLPQWLEASGEILYETPDGLLMAAAYRFEGNQIKPKAPVVWSPLRLGDTGVLANFDLARDGRVLALLPPEDQVKASARLVFVTNFLEELKRKSGERP